MKGKPRGLGWIMFAAVVMGAVAAVVVVLLVVESANG